MALKILATEFESEGAFGVHGHDGSQNESVYFDSFVVSCSKKYSLVWVEVHPRNPISFEQSEMELGKTLQM